MIYKNIIFIQWNLIYLTLSCAVRPVEWMGIRNEKIKVKLDLICTLEARFI